MATKTLHAEMKSTYSEQRWELVFCLFACAGRLCPSGPLVLGTPVKAGIMVCQGSRVGICVASVSHTDAGS